MLTVALCTAQAGAHGQTGDLAQTEAQRAVALLDSSDWQSKSWGAFHAGRLRNPALQDKLIAQLRLMRGSQRPVIPRGDTGEYAFIAALFDALIESGATVPANELEPFLKGWIDPVLILAARDAGSNDLLLRMRSDVRNDTYWISASNLLAVRRSADWYAAMLNELSITHTFVVTNPNAGPVIRGGASGGGYCGDGGFGTLQGYPPLVVYVLTLDQTPGAVTFVEGPRTIYYRRQPGPSSCGPILRRSCLHAEYLAWLAGVKPEDANAVLQPKSTIPFTTAAAFAQSVASSLKAQEQTLRDLLETITKKTGLRSAAGTQLALQPETEDRRESTAAPLPQLPAKLVRLP